MTTIPATMNAIVIQGKGGPDVLVPQAVDTPAPGPGQVLIRVTAAGINRPDIMQRQGTYPAPKGHSEIPGLEVAGQIAVCGEGTTKFAVGDNVCALVNGGGYAEYCVAEEGSCLPLPPGTTLSDAAGIPETVFTVWHNVFQRGALRNGEWFMVHGGASGIGMTAIQMAKAFGATVIATAGSKQKCEACLAIGADHAANYRDVDFVEVVKTVTAKRGVDVILDMVGGDYIARNLRCLADDGRMVNIAYQKGSEATIDFIRVLLKRLTITGSTLRIRPNSIKANIASEVQTHVWPKIADGTIKVVVDSTFPLAEAAKAHARMEEGNHIGKIILQINQ